MADKFFKITLAELPIVKEDPNYVHINPDVQLWAMIANEHYFPVAYLPCNGDLIKIEKDKAYVYDGYYYYFRGMVDNNEEAETPGIYYNKMSRTYFVVLCDPDNPAHDIYSVKNNPMQPQLSADAIRKTLEEKGETIYVACHSNSSRSAIPDITKNDGFLKRAAKTVLKEKNIELDNYKSSFGNKNELFNLKQVLRSPDGKMSIMLFERLMEALHLKYTIIIEEVSPEEACGKKIIDPIRISSEDTFEMSSLYPNEVKELPNQNDNTNDTEDEEDEDV